MPNRRQFLKLCGGGAMAPGFLLPMANAVDYGGKLFCFVQAQGGWDATSFCDPKANVPGERVINRWAERDEIRKAGNLHYAPVARNEGFFEKYHSRMLVINGVDAQTNSHSAGILHNWSGRISEGYPTTTALLAAHLGGEMTMPYLSFGGYSNTAGLGSYTRATHSHELRNVATPARDPYVTSRRFFSEQERESLLRHERRRAARLASEVGLMPRERRSREAVEQALAPGAVDGLLRFNALLSEIEKAGELQYLSDENPLKRQAQLAILAFSAGVAVSADLGLTGFDTHSDHDYDQARALSRLTEGVDYLWELAEHHGIANRLVVVMGSDFGRTNFYNSSQGKDHWPVGSIVVMEKHRSWTDRVIGQTDGLHHALKINPATLQRDDSRGIYLRPGHVHKALRRYFGIENTAASRRFPFGRIEDMPLFG